MILSPILQEVLKVAEQESRDSRDYCIGTEHLLLGLGHFPESLAAHQLQLAGIDLTYLRGCMETARTPAKEMDEVPISPRSQRCLEVAAEIAGEAGCIRVGTHHLLAAFLIEAVKNPYGLAAKILSRAGFEAEALKKAILVLPCE